MATLGEILVMLEGVANDVTEIKGDLKTQNDRVRTNEKSIVRLDTWVKLVAGSEVMAAATLCILRMTGVI